MRTHGSILGALILLVGCGDSTAEPMDSGSTGEPTSTTTTGSTSTSSTTTGPGSSTTEADESSSSAADTTTGMVDPGPPEWPLLECDPIDPDFCGYPFPSDVYTVADKTSATGRRLSLSSELLPTTNTGTKASPDVFNRRDGFTVHGSITAHLPGATTTGLPDPLHIADSLETTSPTVLLDVETGELVPHFSELDTHGAAGDPPALLVQPARPLAYGHRHIVAIRNVVDAGGVAIAPSPVFEALRDGLEHEDPSVEARRGLYADIFEHLDGVGVGSDDLQLAWDFTVASREDTNGSMLHMRDVGMAALPKDGPAFTITSVDEDYSAEIFRRVQGELEVPLFLDDAGPGGKLVLDDDGQPQQQGTAMYPFTIMVPYAAQTNPTPGVLFGHGLFGSQVQVEAGDFQAFANSQGITLAAMDWIGMSSEDPALVAVLIGNGTLHEFATVPDRLQQSLLNFMVLGRALQTSLVADDAFRFEKAAMLDEENTYYYGGSQGGIMGASFMAISTEIERGVLAVPGQPYNLLLERSVDFDPFENVIKSSYPTQYDQRMVLALAQLLWDRAEPSGYSRHIQDDLLPGTPAHRVLIIDSIGDHQVSTLGAHVMARAIGAGNMGPLNREVWGLEEVESPFEGSAIVEHDFGLPPEPIENQPMREGDDPHGSLAGVPSAVQLVGEFLLTGTVTNYCDGVCDPG